MDPKVSMLEYINGKCEAVKESEKFLDNWFDTDGDPCSICSKDRSKCRFYKALRDKGAIDEEENPT